MKINRTKNATRNITSGFALKLYQLITPFVIRTLMIYFLGMEYTNTPEVFAAFSKDKQIRKNSSSGGLFSEVAKYIEQKETKHQWYILQIQNIVQMERN